MYSQKKVSMFIFVSILLTLTLISELYSANRIAVLEDTAEEIYIASWNIKDFGKTKLNDQARIDVIIDVLKKYDIIAIQEVRDKDEKLPEDLVNKINASGANYNEVHSNRLGKSDENRRESSIYSFTMMTRLTLSLTLQVMGLNQTMNSQENHFMPCSELATLTSI